MESHTILILLNLVRSRDPCHVLLENPLIESNLPQSRWIWLRTRLWRLNLGRVLLVYHCKEIVPLHIGDTIGRIIECLARRHSSIRIV